MNPELSLIAPNAAILPQFGITAEAKQLKDSALVSAALIGKVENAEQNAAAVNAQKGLKHIENLFERERKRLKEPLLDAGRQLDRTVAAELVEIEKESGRLQNLTSDFQLAEQRRIREEEELQRRELARIEAEKQAELKRIADEVARKEREATNKKQREAAAKALQESEALRKESEKSAALAAEQSARVEETSAALTYAESRPIQATRVTGQVVKTDWEISVTNPYELAKFHPDCVKIEPVLTAIKARLNEGLEVKGVSAKKKTVASVRAGMPVKAIDL
jgi:hypothetical protein